MQKQGWDFPLFSPDSDDRLSLNFLRFVIVYISCDTRIVGLWTILFTDDVRLLYKHSRLTDSTFLDLSKILRIFDFLEPFDCMILRV